MQQLHLPRPYFAFADLVEPLRDVVALRFDLLHLQHRSMLGRSSLPIEAAAQMPTLLLELEAAVEGIAGLPGLRSALELGGEAPAIQRILEEDAWYVVVLDRVGIPARLYRAPDTADFEKVAVADIQYLEVHDVEQLAELHRIGQAGETDANTIAGLLGLGCDLACLACYDVGQGSCNALCSDRGHPQIYFDLGGGALSHSRTYPASFRVCHSDRQAVVLSHWDIDHWITGQKDAASLDHPWIVPNQSVGPTHLKFASRLYKRGNLHIWPSALATRTVGAVEVLRCNGKSRNDSGLSAIVRVRDGSGGELPVLLPGDARYSHIPVRAGTSFGGLVASHHGAASSGQPPLSQNPARLVYAYGVGNTYGHPHSKALSQHSSAGWSQVYHAPQGSAIVAPPSTPAPLKPPCQCAACDPCCSLACSLLLTQP